MSNEIYPGVWLVGFLAATGAICVSYSRARIESERRQLFDKGLKSLASRDIRLFLIMIGAVAGQAYFCLIVIAALTHAVVFYRLVSAFKHLRQDVK